jgi:oligoribonuclease
MIVFLDLETTGLRATEHEVLEVAAIVTDDQLSEVARFHRVVSAQCLFSQLDEFIRDMHTKNGLWEEAQRPSKYERLHAHVEGLAGQYEDRQVEGGTYSRYDVDVELARFIRDHAVKLGKNDKDQVTISRPQLAGNSIHFDRGFMKVHLPEAEAQLHYRMIDVSTINEMASRFWKPAHDARPKAKLAHRAMPDAEESLGYARYYAAALSAPTPDHAEAIAAATATIKDQS